jgi:hypothetical protein
LSNEIAYAFSSSNRIRRPIRTEEGLERRHELPVLFVGQCDDDDVDAYSIDVLALSGLRRDLESKPRGSRPAV